MCGREVPLPGDGRGPPRPTVGDIFRAHAEAFAKTHALSEEQRKAVRDISVCRTQVLGGHLDVCENCGYQRPVYNSCRNRHCPSCQSLTQARWMEGRLARLLPTDYFHVVFTMPDKLLAGIALRNRELFFDALFAAGSQTLLQLGEDEKRLGAQLGLTAVLHTWTRDLRFHPHLHCIVTGGGLTRDGTRWKSTPQGYLFPVRVLSKLFRGKLVAALDNAVRSGRLSLGEVDWAITKDELYRTKWVSYAKEPFAGPESVYQYLGRYTHRVGLSNHRLQSVTNQAVTFRTRDEKTATLAPDEFIRRFLLHVLPHRFVKIRHYGLLAPGNVNSRLATARKLLEAARTSHAPAPAPTKPIDWRELLLRLTGVDVTRCPVCGGPLRSVPLPAPPPDDTS